MSKAPVRLSSLASMKASKAKSCVSIEAVDSKNEIFRLEVQEGMIGPLVAGLIAKGAKLSPDRTRQTFLTLTGAKAATLPDGKPCLELWFENTLRLVSPAERPALEALGAAFHTVFGQIVQLPPGPKLH